MKTDLSEATFIIPIRIESPDRLRNVVTTTAFLVENFDTNIIIKEVDKEPVFQRDALPILEDILDCNIWENFNYIFERSEEPLFHRQRVLNEMIMECDTDIVVNYDCDVILPKESYELAYKYWPGPLTLNLEKKLNSKISPTLSNYKNLVGCRIPKN